MDDLVRFCCQRAGCADYGKRGAGNLTVRMHYGKDKRLRLLYCRTCHARFSERKGTPLFQARLPEAKVVAVLGHMGEGCGVRKTRRLVRVNRETVACDPADPGDAEQGDQWDHVALDPDHRLVVSVMAGKRTAENVEKVVDDFKARTGGRLMHLITRDEYRAYPPAILNAYGTEVVPPRTGKPGRPKAPHRVAPPELQYATVHKTREKGRIVKVSFRVVFGTVVGVLAALAQSIVSKAINTAFVERQNGTDRNRNARKV